MAQRQEEKYHMLLREAWLYNVTLALRFKVTVKGYFICMDRVIYFVYGLLYRSGVFCLLLKEA